jgi:hypothetical protein
MHTIALIPMVFVSSWTKKEQLHPQFEACQNLGGDREVLAKKEVPPTLSSEAI